MKLNQYDSFYAKAWIRDDFTKTIYTEQAMLVALLAHTHAENRNGINGKIVRELMDDINLD